MKLKYVKVAMFILIATILSTCLVMVSINTEHKQIFIGKPIEFDIESTKTKLEELEKIVTNEEIEKIDTKMRNLVTTYIKPEDANKKMEVV